MSPTETAAAVAFVAQHLAVNNYGSSKTLVDYSSRETIACLRVTMPVIPAGHQLDSIDLRLQTTAEATAGSVSAQRVSLAGCPR